MNGKFNALFAFKSIQGKEYGFLFWKPFVKFLGIFSVQSFHLFVKKYIIDGWWKNGQRAILERGKCVANNAFREMAVKLIRSI